MPVEITLEMYAEKPVVLPFFTGHVARGLLLHFIRQVDQAASGLLHELNVSKPYSVTPLRFSADALMLKARAFSHSPSPVYPHIPTRGELTTGRSISSPHSCSLGHLSHSQPLPS